MRASCITRSVTSCQRQQPIYIYLSAPDTRDAAFQMKFQLCHQICWHSPYAVNTSRPTSTKFASRVNCTLFIAVKMLPSAGVSQSTDLLTARGVAHLVVHVTTGSTSYETIPPVRLERFGGVLSTVDMVMQRRDGPRRLPNDDDDEPSTLLLMMN